MACSLKNPRRQKLATALAAIVVAFLYGSARGEGSVRTFQCLADKVCDAHGSCTPADNEVEFRMEPLQLDAGGAGDYRLSYGEDTVAMRADSDAGPFMWESDGSRHTLLVNSEARLLWHRLEFASPLSSRITFLQCALRQ